MNISNQNTDWNSSDILIQLIKNIEAPLSSIIQANKKDSSSKQTNESSDIIFSSSQKITYLINEVINKTKSEYILNEKPIIFEIYKTNKHVQSMCLNEINSKKISKQDIAWLLKMEKEVYKHLNRKDLNLYDLSCELSVSERQLHRKIKTMLHLTPNKYIRVLKLHKAKQMIDNYLYDNISQVSYAVGYYDTHYFSKLFNQQYNISPKELLNSIK